MKDWPKEVPVLTADDIHKGSYNGPNGTRCLYGWAALVFSGREASPDSSPNEYEVCFVLRSLCSEAYLVDFNDNPNRRKSTIARKWNQAMCKLGYTEGNPEKEWHQKSMLRGSKSQQS